MTLTAAAKSSGYTERTMDELRYLDTHDMRPTDKELDDFIAGEQATRQPSTTPVGRPQDEAVNTVGDAHIDLANSGTVSRAKSS